MLRNAEGEEITLTRAERRRLEKMRGKPVTYQYTLDQIEAIKRQAVADKKEALKKEIAPKSMSIFRKNGKPERSY